MANWKTLDTNYFKINYKDAAGSYPSGKHSLVLQYDEDSAEISDGKASIDVRFKWYMRDSSICFGKDEIFVLYDANNESSDPDVKRTLFKVKGHTEDSSGNPAAYYSPSFTLTKSAGAGQFFLQDVWICNDGENNTDESDEDAFYNKYKSGGSRGSYAYRQSAGQYIPIYTTKTVASEGTAPTISSVTSTATENSVTVTIKGIQGKKGDNNPLSGMALYYTIDESTPSYDASGNTKGTTERIGFSSSEISSGASYTKTITGLPTDKKSFTLKVIARSYFSGDGSTKTSALKSSTVSCWSAAGAPTLTLTAGAQGKSFSAKVIPGKGGTNNTLKNTYVFYTTNGSTPAYTINGTTASPKSGVSSMSPLSKSSDGTYTGEVKGFTASKNIKAIAVCVFAKEPVNSGVQNLSMTYQPDGGVPTIVLINNGNNTFNISGYQGSQNSTTNPIKSTTVYCDIFWGSFRQQITFKPTAKSGGKYEYTNINFIERLHDAGYIRSFPDTYKIEAYARTSYEVGYKDSGKITLENISYYIKPTFTASPVLTTDSYKNNRLTVKQPWTFTWDKATAGNTSSPIIGYEITIYKVVGTNRYEVLTSTIASNSFTFDPVQYNFEPGYMVYAAVRAYTQYGNKGNLYSDSVSSEMYTVENSGIMRVKVGNTWKEGQVFVKVGNTWKEAEAVYTKVAGSWKESV